ncbi:MAG: phosphodiester glycosidase family protein [Bacteroidales bacterium]|nr:phosphodiester glycosidase family protein [Bacteroidales bacterium]
MKRNLFSIALLLCICIAAGAQRYNVRSEVLADRNLCAGLDGLYPESVPAGTPAPKGYEAVYVSHYGRHGSRYAYTEKAYTVLLNMLSEAQQAGNLTPRGEALMADLLPFWDNVRYRVGDLVPMGWDQQSRIAATMVKNYPSAFGKGSSVDACSSPAVRSVVSMSAFCASLSRQAPKADLYEHQSTMDIQATRPNMKNPFAYSGPAMPFPFREDSEAFFLRHFPGYDAVLARLFKDPQSALGDRNPWSVFFNLYMFVAGMNSLPEAERINVDGFFTPEEYATLWETDNYERFREYYQYRTACTSIVEDIVAKADERLASKKRGADLRFGHDHVVMPLLMIMDIDGFGTIPASSDEVVYWFQSFRSPMAANIQFVFYAPKKGKGDILVKVLLNGDEVILGDLPKAQGPYYRWSELRGYLKSRVAVFANRPDEGSWKEVQIGDGLTYRSFSGTDSVSGAPQQVFVVDWDTTRPGYSLKFSYDGAGAVTSDIFARTGAVVAMNACYEPPSVVLKVDGELISCVPNGNVMDTGVPNWKSSASVTTDGGRDIHISYDGKGMSLSELRRFYSTSTASNIFTSAPMLIDDYVPVGETYAGFYSASDLEKFNYEDARRHQGVRHPRTAVALTEDGHFLMVVVDGRRKGVSEGMSARELTRFLVRNFNPRWALNMDGGGSSTLCVEGQGDENTHVVNYPTGNKRYDHAGERVLYSHFYLVKD